MTLHRQFAALRTVAVVFPFRYQQSAGVARGLFLQIVSSQHENVTAISLFFRLFAHGPAKSHYNGLLRVPTAPLSTVARPFLRRIALCGATMSEHFAPFRVSNVAKGQKGIQFIEWLWD